jgi:ABC-2 type transport system ATP-binding protein
VCGGRGVPARARLQLDRRARCEGCAHGARPANGGPDQALWRLHRARLARPRGGAGRGGRVPGAERRRQDGDTGAETLDFIARLHGSVDREYRDELVERFQLDPGKKVRAYSKGNRQKVNLIAALASRAELLILDEPTSGLDPLMEAEFRECCREARERGQAIFLSSHILSEIEALCDRVGILRAGQLIDIGTLAEMRHLAALRIEATFAGPPPDLAGLPGVENVRVTGNVLSCQVQGAVGPVLGRLAKAEVTELISREPSLEELFLAHYGADG